MINIKNKELTSKKEIRDYYLTGAKPKHLHKFGMEYERITTNKNDFSIIPYHGEKSIFRLLRQIAFKDEWSYLVDFGQVVGLKKGQSTITLEPGGQFEISVAAQFSIKELEKELEKLTKKTNDIAKNLNISFLSYGISPLKTYKDISLIPKRRYEIMSRELLGDHHSNMMRETAGLQVTMDYETETDAMKKLQLGLKLSPVICAMFANSPIYNGKLSGYKSYRALAWLFTDNKRCGLINEKFFFNNIDLSFDDYINKILKIPMLYIMRDNKIIEFSQQIDFETFLNQGFQGHNANFYDYLLHASLFFPEVRLNNYLEFRNHDSQKGTMKYALAALYKGIFFNTRSISDTMELFKKFNYSDFAFARESVPRLALEAQLGSYKLHNIAKELLKIASIYLRKEGKNENKYLEPLQELINQNMCPADLIIKNWESKWSRNLKKLIDSVAD